MTEDIRRPEDSAARETRLDRALDRLLMAEPEPAVPPGLSERILAAAWATPQERLPAPPARRGWYERPRALAATFAAAAVIGFVVGWVDPSPTVEGTAIDATATLFGDDLELES
ncbi:MAG: hypothetical protein AB7O45_09230 [Alphaproteobacteria bacterium]